MGISGMNPPRLNQQAGKTNQEMREAETNSAACADLGSPEPRCGRRAGNVQRMLAYQQGRDRRIRGCACENRGMGACAWSDSKAGKRRKTEENFTHEGVGGREGANGRHPGRQGTCRRNG